MKKLIALMLSGFFAASVNVQSADIALPEIGDSAGAIISPEQEFRIGQSFFWRLQQSIDLLDDPEIENYLTLLGNRLVANSDAPERFYTFFMVPDTSINAFAAPGGFIGVNTGLLLASHTESELASVLAHEIGHITQRHILRSIEKQQQMSLPMTVAMIGAAILGVANPQLGTAAITAVQAGGVQLQIDFTRAHEKEADNAGMATLARSGFDTNAMASFFERLQAANRFQNGNGVPEFLRTHPVTISRIAEARSRALRYSITKQLGDDVSFYLMREKLKVMSVENLHELLVAYRHALSTGSNSSEIATRYGYSRALLANGEYTQAREVLAPLIESDPDRLSYQLLLAEIEIAVGNYRKALVIFEDFQRLYPDDYALSMIQAKALLMTNQPQQSYELLERQLEVGSNSRVVYKAMAQAKKAMGQNSAYHSWLAEFYFSSGQLRGAADQLRLAADYAKKQRDEYGLAKITARLRQVETAIEQMRPV
jgi:predicted Zn-dependent protease